MADENVDRIPMPDGSTLTIDADGKETIVPAAAPESPPAQAAADAPAPDTAPAPDEPAKPDAQAAPDDKQAAPEGKTAAAPGEDAEGEPPAAEPADGETVEALKAQLAEARAAEARSRQIAAKPPTVLPPAADVQPAEVEFEADFGDPPDFAGRKFASDEEAAAAVREHYEARAKEAAEAHAKKLLEAHQTAQRQQAQTVAAQAAMEAERQQQAAAWQEAQRRSGLEPAEFARRRDEVRRNAIPAGYTGGADDALPANYLSRMMDASLQVLTEAGVPTDGYETSADLATAAVEDPAFVRAITDSFPFSPGSFVVLQGIAEGPHAVTRMKALTTTDEGKKLLADLIARVPPAVVRSRAAFDAYAAHAQKAASQFDSAPAPKNVKPAADPPPPLTPPTRSRTTTPAKAAKPAFGEPGWEEAQQAAEDAFIADYSKNHGGQRPPLKLLRAI